MIGRVGFFNPEGWPGFEVGWTLARAALGNGYATEGARRALAYAFDVLGEEKVINVIQPEHAASPRSSASASTGRRTSGDRSG